MHRARGACADLMKEIPSGTLLGGGFSHSMAYKGLQTFFFFSKSFTQTKPLSAVHNKPSGAG